MDPMDAPGIYTSLDDCKQHYDHHVQTNPKYSTFYQFYYTAGDPLQFKRVRCADEHRSMSWFHPRRPRFVPYRRCKLTNLCPSPVIDRPLWRFFQVDRVAAYHHTFYYLFDQFREGIAVQIRNNKLVTFLPFCNALYENEWSQRIKCPNWNALFERVCAIENRKFKFKFVHKNQKAWYCMDTLLRYDYVYREYGTGIPVIYHMFHTLCQERTLPDIDFFVHRGDHPLLMRNLTEPWNSIDPSGTPLSQNAWYNYAPLLSMCTTHEHADLPIPTWDDWARVMRHTQGLYFPKLEKEYDSEFEHDWSKKRPTAVFRGSSTGRGVTRETNPRLKVAWMDWEARQVQEGESPPLLDAGLIRWNARPRIDPCTQRVSTFADKDLVPLVEPLSLSQQSTYKYIIHIEGHVAAFRLTAELATRSVLLIVESRFKLWCSHLLQPWVHYVPVRSDLSDLLDQIRWCRTHDAECEQIAHRAYQFWEQWCHKDALLNVLHDVLLHLKRHAQWDLLDSPLFRVKQGQQVNR
jgi:hypothetical protein